MFYYHFSAIIATGLKTFLFCYNCNSNNIKFNIQLLVQLPEFLSYACALSPQRRLSPIIQLAIIEDKLHVIDEILHIVIQIAVELLFYH